MYGIVNLIPTLPRYVKFGKKKPSKNGWTKTFQIDINRQLSLGRWKDEISRKTFIAFVLRTTYLRLVSFVYADLLSKI